MSRKPYPQVARILLLGLVTAVLLFGLAWQFKRHSVVTREADWLAVSQSPLAEHFARQDLAGRDRRDAFLPRHLLAHYGRLDFYAAANRKLPPASPGRVILYGDSITEFWPVFGAKEFFPGHDYIDRGIRGQTTPELLWRFRQDALDLHPDTIVLLGGANDILLRSRYITLHESERNLQAMVEAAGQQHIRVILCLLTPISLGHPDRHRKFTAEIRELNAWISNYAKDHHLATVNYFDAMAAPDGTMRDGISLDGVHPNEAGYAIMRPLVQQALDATR